MVVKWDSVEINVALAMPFVALAFGLVLLHGQPTPPGAPSACAGGVTVLVNGQPLSSGCVLNLLSGSGIIATPKANPAIGGTDIHFDADTAVLQPIQVGPFFATSSPSGVTFAAATQPVMLTYRPGQILVMQPDVATFAGSTLNLNSLGPIAIQGTCSPPVCILVSMGSPVNEFLVYP